MNSDVKKALSAYNKRTLTSNTKDKDVSAALDLYEKRRRYNAETELERLSQNLVKEQEAYNSYIKSNLTHGYGSEAAKDTLDKQRQSRVNISKIKRDIEAYKDILDEKKFNSLISEADSVEKGYQQVVDWANYFSQWEDENSYNNWVSAEKTKKEQLDLDLPTAQKEIDEMQKRASFLDDQIKGLKANQKLSNISVGAPGQTQLYDPYLAKSNADNSDLLAKYQEEYEQLSQNLAKKKQYVSVAERLQSNAKLVNDAKNSEDFEQLSTAGLSIIENSQNTPSEENVRDVALRMSGSASSLITSQLNDWLYSTTGEGATADSKAKINALTEDEKKVYAYYLGKNDTESAKAYLDSMDDILTQRVSTGIFETQYEDNVGREMLFGVKAGLNQNREGIIGFANQIAGNEEYQAPSGTDYVSAFIRNDLSEEGVVHQGAYDLITTTSNMMPSILTSTLIGTVAPGIGQVVGAGMMGMTASGSAYQEMINLGYNKEQARTYGMLVGASETALGTLLGGISKLGGAAGTKVIPKALTSKFVSAADTAIGNLAIRYGSSMLSEFSEEALQEILDPVFQNIAVGYNLNDLSDIELSEVLYSGLLGALSAGILEGVGITADTVNTAQIGSSMKKAGNIESLKELGNTLSTDSVAYRIANKVNEKSSAYTIGKLFNEVGATLNEGNIASLKSNLISRGMSENDAQVLAEAYAYGVVNDTVMLTPAQEEVFKNNEVLATAVHEELIAKNNTYNQQVQRFFEFADSAQSKKVAKTTQNSTKPTTETVDGVNADTFEGAIENTVENDFKQTTYNGEAISFKYKSADAVELDNGETVSVEDITMSDDDAVFYDAIMGENDIFPEARFVNGKLTSGVNISTANEIRKIFGGTPTINQLKGVKMYYQYGMYNIKRFGESGALTETQERQVFNLGRALSESFAEKESNTPKVKKYSKGKVKYNVKSELSSRQHASVEVIEKLADMFNITFNLYESTLNENNEWISVMPNGEKTSANGYYMNGEIYVDINAGSNGKGAVLYTVAHELTHYIREWSPKKFKVLADFLVEQYESKGKSVDYYVNKQMEKARKSGNKNMKYSEAFEEFVADSMEKMLTDQNAVEKLAMLRTKDKSVFDKLRESIQKLVDRIKQEYAKLTPDSAEGRTVATMTDVFSDIQDLFLEALDDASTNFQKAEKNTATNDGVKMQLRGINKEGIEVYETNEEVKKLSYKERMVKFLNVMESQYNGRTAKFVRNGHNYYAKFETSDVKKNIYGDNRSDKKGWKAKITVGAEGDIFDLVENAKYDGSKPETGKTTSAHREVDYWDYFIKTVQIDSNVFDLIANVRKKSDGEFVYSIQLNENKKMEASPPLDTLNSGLNRVLNASNNSVPQENTTVNNNSMQENENNTQKKFSLRENVEETKDLVAVHNLSAEKLLKSLNLGGLPMPSIAIMKAKDGHNQFGDISLVFRKDTIDPEADKSNKVYSVDAWTPTYPRTEYKVNEDVASKIYHRARSAGETTFFKPVHFHPDNIVDEVNSFGGIEGVINHYKNDHSMKQFYLAETSEPVKMIMGEERNELSKQEIEQFDFVINALGKDNILKLNTEGYSGRNWMQEFGEEYKTALVKYYRTTAKASVTDEEIREIVESQKAYEHASNVKRIKKYIESGPIEVTPVQDYKATQKEIDNRVNQDEYIAWLTELFDGLVEKSGIRNNVDPYTSRGDKKSFEATHYVENLENVVKAMKEQQDVGNSFLFSGFGIWGVASKRFNSIDEIKADSNRLVEYNEELFSEVKRSIGGKLTDIADTILNPRESNYFIARDNAIDCILETIATAKTRSGMLKQLKSYYALNQEMVTESLVQDIIDLVAEVQSMPTDYFEAKPQRAVHFDEVAGVIMPSQESYEVDLTEIKNKLSEYGVPIVEYTFGSNDERIQALNSLEGVKFSERGQSVYKLLGENQRLQKENERLKEKVKYLNDFVKLQRKITHGKIIDRRSTEAQARKLKKSTGSKIELSNLTDQLYSFYTLIISGSEDLVWDTVLTRASWIANDILNEVPESNQRDEYAQEILSYIRSKNIRLNDVQRAEVENIYNSYNAYRKRLMGSITISQKGTSLDSVWQDLAEQYPDTFSKDTNPADMPLELADIIHTLRNSYEVIEEFDKTEQVRWLAEQIYDTYWDVSTVESVMDKLSKEHQQQINELKMQHAERVKKIYAKHQEDLKDQKAYYQEMYKRLRERATASHKKQMLDYQDKVHEAQAKAIEKRNNTETRRQILKTLDKVEAKLFRPTKEKNIGLEMQPLACRLLTLANLDTVDADYRIERLNTEMENTTNPQVLNTLQTRIDNITKQGEKKAAELQRKRNKYKAIAADAQNSLQQMGKTVEIDEVIDKTLKDIEALVGGTPIRRMTSYQLECLKNAVNMVDGYIRADKQLFIDGKKQDVENTAQIVIHEVLGNSKKEKQFIKQLEWLNKAGWSVLKPETAFDLIGSSALSKLFQEARKGDDKFARSVSDAQTFLSEKVKKYGADKWDMDERREFMIQDEKVTLTLGEILSLYAYSKREQAIPHLESGGFVQVEPVKKKIGGKINIEYTVYEDHAHRISKVELGSIINALTKEQVEFADVMQEYLSTVMGAKGNEISRELYQIDLFKEKFYFPLKLSSVYKYFKKNENSKTPVLKNAGMTKPTVTNANDPIVIESFENVWANHVVQMSRYNAYVLGIENLTKVFGYTGIDKSSVRAALQGTYGDAAIKYIENFIIDLNGGRKGMSHSDMVNVPSKLLNTFKKVTVSASLSTAIQQPSAIIRAMSYVKPKYFIMKKDEKISHKENWEELKRYAPIATLKEIGGFDMSAGVNVVDYLKQRDYKGKEKLIALAKDSKYRDDLLMWGASKADEVAWSTLWNAIKKEQRYRFPNMEKEKFLKICGERFTDVATKTQVYDSVFTRSEIMRSPNEINKMATAFMGEPMTNLNIIVDTIIQRKRGKISRMQAGANIGCVYLAQIVAAASASIVYAMRDDDDDESFVEKYMSAFSGKFRDEIATVTWIPYVRDAISLFQGYDVSRTDMSVIADIADSIKDLKSKSLSPFDKISGIAGSFAAAFGLPLKNLIRDGKAIWNAITMIFDSNVPKSGDVSKALAEGFFGEKNMAKANECLSKGKTEKANKIINDLLEEKTEKNISNGKTPEKAEKDAKSSIRSSLTSYWKPLFIKAYQEDDYIEQEEIYERLLSTGIYGTSGELKETIEKWVKDLQ